MFRFHNLLQIYKVRMKPVCLHVLLTLVQLIFSYLPPRRYQIFIRKSIGQQRTDQTVIIPFNTPV